jgi:hypothetical protein
MDLDETMNKKSIFFSLFSVFLVTIFYLSLKISTKYDIHQTDMELTRTRIEVLNSIINDLDQRYFERMLYVSTKSALGAMSQYATQVHTLNNLKLELNSTLMTEALINGYDLSVYPDYHLGEINLKDLINELNQKFQEIGLKIQDLNIHITSIEQKDEWNVKVGYDIQYYFQDENNVASWIGDTHKEIIVSIIGMYDPDSGQKINSTNFMEDPCSPNCNSFIHKLEGQAPDIIDIGYSICYSTDGNTCT